MVTVEELERVQGLIKRLQSVGAVAPGVIISADAWNVLVDSVVEIARSLVELGSGEVPSHEHRDQVGLAWLDARVRALVEGGPLVEPAAQARLQDLEHARGRLDTRLGVLDETLGALRTETREVKTRDLAREQSVNVVRRKLEGVSDARDDVDSLRSTLDSIGGRVDEAVELGRLLRAPGGEPVDVGGLDERVAAVEGLRDRLRFASGEDFDATLLDQRLAGLRAEMVSEDELREAVEDLRRKGDDDTDAISERLTAQVDTRFDEREQELEGRLEGLADARVEKLSEQLPGLVGDAVEPVEERVRAQAAEDAGAVVAGAVAEAEARLDARLSAFGETLRGEVAVAVDGLRATLDARVTERLDALLPERLADLGDRVEGAEKRLGAIDDAFSSVRDQLGGVDARMDQLLSTTQADTAGLRQQLSALDGRLDAVARDVDDVRGLAKQIEESLDERAVAAAKSVIQGELDGMRDEVRRIVEDQLAGLEDKVIARFEASAADVIERRVGTTLRKEMRVIASEVFDERGGH